MKNRNIIMNKFLLLLIFIKGLSAMSQTVSIGNQQWMTKNLDVVKFRNGEEIPEAKSDEEWRKAGERKEPAWCYYDNSRNPGSIGVELGKLYNFYAVTDPRGIAPVGFHVPTVAEWSELIEYIGGDLVSGKILKSTQYWTTSGAFYNFTTNNLMITNGNGTDDFGFTALPGGRRHGEGNFGLYKEYGFWWSCSGHSLNYARRICLKYNYYSSAINYCEKDYGLSIRCVKD
jgi:uncharacterized protein (TIGR02145 family)